MDAAASSAQRLRQVRDLPCPRGLPLIGNLHQLNAPKLHRVLEQWAEEPSTIEEITAFAKVPNRMPVRLELRPTVESPRPQATYQPGRD
ncbi:hypothetical protein [Paraburkholderia sp. BR10882]|uniref:hypothetical protein n=1 Tax=unclassified Paraburkholderia TaxID=2615204 RepID=UPI0034CEE5D1